MGSNALSGVGKGLESLAGGFSSMMTNKAAFDEKKSAKDIKAAALKRRTKREDAADKRAESSEKRSADTAQRAKKKRSEEFSFKGGSLARSLKRQEGAFGLKRGSLGGILNSQQYADAGDGSVLKSIRERRDRAASANASDGVYQDDFEAEKASVTELETLMHALEGMQQQGKPAGGMFGPDAGSLGPGGMPGDGGQGAAPSGNMYGDGDLFGDPQAMKQEAVQQAAAEATQADQGPGTEPIDRENAGSLLNLTAQVMDPTTDPGTMLRSWMMLHEKFGIPIPMEIQQLMGIMQPEQQMFGGGQQGMMGGEQPGMYGPPQGGQMRGGL